MELAKEILGGKYEFVLTTHIDKDHVHNHLIFNAVSFADHKHYHSNKRSYHYIRRTSDRLCKEHGLSVIIPGQDKGKSYIEHQVVMNMIFVYVGGKYKFILAAQNFFCKLHADFMGLLRRDLPRLKGLDQVAPQVRSLVNSMAAGPGKFDIRSFGGAAIEIGRASCRERV